MTTKTYVDFTTPVVDADWLNDVDRLLYDILNNPADDAAVLTGLGVTATAAELNVLDGITSTVAELNYVDGVTSAIQTQLDAKAALAGNAAQAFAASTFTGDLTGDVTGNADTATTATTVSTTVASAAIGTTQSAYDASTKIATTAYADRAATLRSYLAGCTLSTAGSSATMSIAAGQVADSTNTVLMGLSAIAKTTSAWAVGTAAGGLDTGAIANSTWYYFYVIRRTDTGVVDVVFSTSSTSPTLPTSYTQYRYIGAGKTNGSAQWTSFTQMGREFYWATPILDFNAAGSATAALLTCSLPLGRKMKGYFNIIPGANTAGCYISDPSNTDLAPSQTIAPLESFGYTSASFTGGGQVNCWTDTSGRVRHSEVNTATLLITTLGWIDLADTNL